MCLYYIQDIYFKFLAHIWDSSGRLEYPQEGSLSLIAEKVYFIVYTLLAKDPRSA